MQLIEVRYAYVARYARQAARDRVSLADTQNTRWFRLGGHEGFCGLISIGGRQRVKGVYVHPEYRGMGYGTKMTEDLLKIAAWAGGPVEVLAYNPAFYEARGFSRVTQLSNGAWRLVKE